ncbi:MAG TPA: HlyD family efflux transporter periplasmic adaptor subunit [Steroidobacteraceae bacterium]|nr:HlyD family efflux transporter periplasmic adaptor subunit [Steroidobacteraceae bacterium]
MDVPRTDFLQVRRKRRIAFGVVGGLAVAGVAYAIVRLDPISVSVERSALLIDTVQRGEFVRQIRGPGVLVPKDLRWLAAQASGRVERVLLKPGATVEPDSIIAVLGNPELERVVQEAEWALTQGEAEVAAMKLQLKDQVLDQKSRVAEARANFESTRLQAEAEAEAARVHAVSTLQARRSQILSDQLAARLQVENDRLVTLGDATRAQLRAQSARLEQLRNVLARQRQQLASLQVRAGMSGVVQALPVQVGQQIAAGTQIARVARPDDLIAELKIPELQAKDLAAGQRAQIDTRGAIIQGRVSRVDPAVENGAVRVEVELTGNLPPGARPDLSVDGVVEIERRPQSLYVARPATGEPESEASVFKVEPGGGRAKRISVRLGKASVNEILVLSGLNAGDRIIVSDISQWSASDELRIR